MRKNWHDEAWEDYLYLPEKFTLVKDDVIV